MQVPTIRVDEELSDDARSYAAVLQEQLLREALAGE